MLKLVKKYLDLNFYLNTKEEFEELFLSHPNYPSVYAITDSFDMLSIENVAVKVPKQQLSELPDSFLAVFNEELVLVTKTDKSIQVHTEKGERLILSNYEFTKGWNGIIIAIETNQTIIEVVQSNSRWVAYCTPILFLTILSIIYNDYTLGGAVLLISSLLGVLVSVFIVQEKFGLKNEMISKFCNINPNTSCDSVIQSGKGTINKWLNFTDLPLLFFSINVVAIILNPIDSAKTVSLLSVLSFPVIAYSIWIQKFQIKKWCILCLVISGILVFQGFIGYFSEKSLFTITLFNDFSYLFSLVVLTSVWFALKPILETKFKTESDVKELKKFKRNYNVFDFLSHDLLVLEGFDKLQALQFGSPKSSVSLTVILSPSCSHCHKVFEEAINLVDRYPERIFLNVLFNINPKNSDNPYKIVVERILYINKVYPEKMEEAISDWHIRKIGLEAWMDKWEVETIPMEVTLQIQQQYNWCLENEFNYTPVKIVNEKLYPSEYDINELKYFINDFIEDIESAETEITNSNNIRYMNHF